MAANMGSAVGYLDLDARGFLSGLDQVNAKAQKTSQSMSNSFASGLNSIGGSLQKTGGMIEGFGKGLSSVGKTFTPITAGLTAMGGAAVKTTIGFTKLYESSMVVFEKMLGGKSAADDLYSSLLGIAKASTFSQEAFLKSGKVMVGMGMDAQSTTKYMQAITDAVAGFGGSSENLEQVATIFAKINTAGKVDMLDINQLANNGIQVLKVLGNQYGKTTTEMRDMVSSGALPAKEAMDLLAEGIENGTDGVNGMTAAMEGMSLAMKGKTLTGALDSLNSGFRAFSLNLTGINPTLRETDEGFDESQKRLQQLTAIVSTISNILPGLSKMFSGVTDAIGKLLDKLIGTNVTFNETTGQWENIGGVLKKVQDAFADEETVAKLKKLGDALLVMAGAGAGLPILGKVVQGFGGNLKSAGKLFGGVSNVISTQGTNIKNNINKLKGIFGNVGSAFSEPLKSTGSVLGEGFKAFGQTALKNLSGVGDFFMNGFDLLKGRVGLGLGVVKDALAPMGNKLLDVFVPIGANIVNKVGGLGDTVKNGLGAVGGKFQSGFDTISSKMEPFTSKIKSGFDKVSAPFGAFGEKVKGGLGKIAGSFDGFGGKIGSALDGALGLIKGFVPKFIGLLGFGAIAGAIVVGLGLLNNSMGGGLDEMITGFFAKIPAMMTGFQAKIAEQLPGIMQSGMQVIIAVLNGIATVLPSVVETGAMVITQLISGLAGMMPSLIPLAINVILTLIETLIQNLPQIVLAGMELLQGIVQGLINAIPRLVTMLPQIITTIITVLTENLPIILDMGLRLLVEIVNGLVKAIPQLITMLPQIINTIIQVLTQNLPTILNMGIKLLIEIINGLVRAIPQLISYLPTIITTIVMVLTQNLPLIIQAAIQIIVALIKGLVQAIPQLAAMVPQIVSAIVDVIRNTDWWSIGKDIIRGIAEGLKNTGHMLWDAVKDLLGSFKDNVLSFFGIESPSRWGRDMVGKMIPAGIALGFIDEMPQAEKDMQASLDKEMSKLGVGDVDIGVTATQDGIGTLTDGIQSYYEMLYGYLYLTNEMIQKTVQQIGSSGQLLAAVAGANGSGIGYSNPNSLIDTTDPNRSGGISSGDTYITINSPTAMDEIEAARQFKRTQKDIAEGF